MTLEEIVDRAKQIVDSIDQDTYPEIYEIISELAGEDFWFPSVMEVANELHDADAKNELPKDIAKLLIDIYTSEAETDKTGDALCDLGSLYYTGRCGVQDYKTAYDCYEKAAQLGSRQAQENLGYCYYYGRLGEKNYEKAYHYFVKGALEGHLSSLYKIGDMYKNGYYVDKDEKEAFCIYSYCLDCLDDANTPTVGADVYIRLADCYYYGLGTEKDFALALQYYQKAESLYFDRLSSGDFMYKKQLERAIEMQENARKELMNKLPKYEWTK